MLYCYTTLNLTGFFFFLFFLTNILCQMSTLPIGQNFLQLLNKMIAPFFPEWRNLSSASHKSKKCFDWHLDFWICSYLTLALYSRSPFCGLNGFIRRCLCCIRFTLHLHKPATAFLQRSIPMRVCFWTCAVWLTTNMPRKLNFILIRRQNLLPACFRISHMSSGKL